MNPDVILQNVHQALNEDLNQQTPEQGDITANLIPKSQQITAKLISREAGIFCGQAERQVFAMIELALWSLGKSMMVKLSAPIRFCARFLAQHAVF